MASQTQTTSPWGPLQEPITNAVDSYSNLVSQPLEYFPTSTVAPQSANTQAGTSALAGTAPTQTATSNQATRAYNFNLNNLLNPESNPFLRASADNAVSVVMENLMKNVLPYVGRGAVQAGGYGGTAHANLDLNAINNAVREGMNMTENMYSNNYGNNLQAYMQSLGMTPMIQQAQTTPAQTMLQAGGITDAYNQAVLNDEVNRHNFEQTAQMDVLDRYLRTLFGGPGGQVVGTEETDPSAVDKLIHIGSLGIL